VQHLIDVGSLAYANLSMGKGVLGETNAGFLGVYSRSASDPAVREAIESADIVIAVGVIFADVSTAGFTQRIDPERQIDTRPYGVTGESQKATVHRIDGVRQGMGRKVNEAGISACL
jgi:indolepyruvate decarboxylase